MTRLNYFALLLATSRTSQAFHQPLSSLDNNTIIWGRRKWRSISCSSQLYSSFDLTPDQYLEFGGSSCRGEQNVRIAYRYFVPSVQPKNSAKTTVVFLNGLLSNMSGIKSKSIQQFANEKGASYVCFDYRGHGKSSGIFIDCTMHTWIEDARNMIEHAMNLAGDGEEQEVILIGSSIGAWIALHLALECAQHNISGLIGIGSAIDFTQQTFEKKLTEEQQSILTNEQTKFNNPTVNVHSPFLTEIYPFSQALYESGNEYLLCNDSYPVSYRGNYMDIMVSDIKCSSQVRIVFLHGSDDDVVPSSTITKTVDIIQSKYHAKDVSAKILNGGDHRLSREDDIAVILDTLDVNIHTYLV